jgi:hypothetical protein
VRAPAAAGSILEFGGAVHSLVVFVFSFFGMFLLLLVVRLRSLAWLLFLP